MDEQHAGFQSRIVGGQAAAVNQFPWHVWIRSYAGAANIVCGGSIISGSWILTAAHCVRGYTSFTVGAGSNNLNSPVIQVNTTSFVVHPSFNPSNYNNDLALLQLPVVLPTSANMSPIRLPARSQANATFANIQGTLTGFGRLNQGK